MNIYCQVLLYHLADWTDVCTTTGDADFFDHDTWVTRTGMAFTAKDAGEIDIATALAFRVHIISIGTATFFDTEIHDVFDLV